MEQPQERRIFLGRLLAGISAAAAFPLFGRSKQANSEQNTEKSMDTHPIKSVKALGFQWETQDPFLFCVHHEDNYPKGNQEMGPDATLDGRFIGQDFIIKDGWRMYHGDRVPGFPGHPHRGFETVTVVRKGLVDHADSTGAAGRYGNGDVQWMTAGKGVQHSEMFPLLNQEEANPLELFQIWLNLPAKNKMVEPHFKMLWAESIPLLALKDENEKVAYLEVIAGTFNGEMAPTSPPDSWAADANNHVGIFNIRFEAGASLTLPKIPEGINRTLYYYEGEGLKIEGTEIPAYHGVELHPGITVNIKNGATEGKILVLQGRPINEPVVQHGPFVMNTREEIREAFEEYHATQFGGWPWQRYDQVHDRNLGRFAKHADGREEIKG